MNPVIEIYQKLKYDILSGKLGDVNIIRNTYLSIEEKPPDVVFVNLKHPNRWHLLYQWHSSSMILLNGHGVATLASIPCGVPSPPTDGPHHGMPCGSVNIRL